MSRTHAPFPPSRPWWQADGCDLLFECDLLPTAIEYINENNADRVILYLLSFANYVPEPDDSMIYRVVYDISTKLVSPGPRECARAY